MGSQRVRHNWETSLTSHYSPGTARQSYPSLPHQVSHTPSSHVLTTGWNNSSYTRFDPSQRPKDKHLPWLQHVYNTLHFLTQKGTPILNAPFISELLHVSQLWKQAAVIYFRGHQWHSPISFYNNIADHQTKRQAAFVSPVFTMAQIVEPNIRTLLSYLHSLFHPSAKLLKTLLQNFIELTKDDVTYWINLTQTCTICQQTNPNSNICLPPFPTH